MDRGAWQATVNGIAEWDMTEHMGNTPPPLLRVGVDSEGFFSP